MTEAFWAMLQSQVSNGRLWLEIAYLICLFLVLIYKPERIRSLFMFRGACLTFVLALLVPILVNLVTSAASTADAVGKPRANYGDSGMYPPDGGPVRRSPISSEGSFMVQLFFTGLNTIGPILFVISVYLAFNSLIPTPNPYAQPHAIRPGVPSPPRPTAGSPQPNIARPGTPGEAPIFDSGGQS